MSSSKGSMSKQGCLLGRQGLAPFDNSDLLLLQALWHSTDTACAQL